MAEAIAVVGALSSVLQVLECTAKIVSHASELIKSGEQSLKENQDTEALANTFNTLGQASKAFAVSTNQATGQSAIAGLEPEPHGAQITEKLANELRESFGGYGNAARRGIEEQFISKLGTECEIESRKLLAKLKDLHIDPDLIGPKRFVHTTKRVVKSLHRREEIEQSRRQLHELNGQLATAILQSLYAKQNAYAQPVLSLLEAIGLVDGDDMTKVAELKIKQRQLRARTDLIIQGLRYSELTYRWDAIDQAYPLTYQWAFQDESLLLRPWIEKGSGIFWVTGKAGSGKSTLMKFICQHYETRRLLTSWGRHQETVLATFFFWYAGTDLQRSIPGLMRTILYQILLYDPDLAQIAFPHHFDGFDGASSHNYGPIEWKREELVKALSNLASLQSDRLDRKKFCIFIDGLDEYRGNHLELVTLLTDLARNANIKVCLSSRPWNAFSNAFQNRVANLRLEDLSKPDIRYYVSGCIHHGLFQRQNKPSHKRWTRFPCSSRKSSIRQRGSSCG